MSLSGWYSEDGEPIYKEPFMLFADGDGSVTAADALTALRAATDILTLTSEQTAPGDMDGNSTVEVSDAIAIFRLAMGLI